MSRFCLDDIGVGDVVQLERVVDGNPQNNEIMGHLDREVADELLALLNRSEDEVVRFPDPFAEPGEATAAPKHTLGPASSPGPRFGERLRAALVELPVGGWVQIHGAVISPGPAECLRALAEEIDADRDALQAEFVDGVAYCEGCDRYYDQRTGCPAEVVFDFRQRIEAELRPAVMNVRLPGSSRETEVVALEGVFSAFAEAVGEQRPVISPDGSRLLEVLERAAIAVRRFDLAPGGIALELDDLVAVLGTVFPGAFPTTTRVAGGVVEVEPQAGDRCQCGHRRDQHVYDAGVCRPGVVCSCEAFMMADGDGAGA